MTAAEYKLLCLFMRNPKHGADKRTNFLDKLWDCDGNYIDSSTLYGLYASASYEDRG